MIITQVWQDDTLTINVPGVGNVTYTGVTFYLASGPAVFTPMDWQVLQRYFFQFDIRKHINTDSINRLWANIFYAGNMDRNPDGAASD